MNHLNYLLGVLTPFALFVVYSIARDTLFIYRSVMKYGGENPKNLRLAGRGIQRVIQALTGRRREEP